MLMFPIYQLTLFSESSKNWMLGETFCTDSTIAVAIAGTLHLGSKRMKKGTAHIYMSKGAKGERLSKNLCVYILDISFPHHVRSLDSKVPPRNLPFPLSLPFLKNLCSIPVFYCVQTLGGVLQFRDLSACLPSPALFTISSQVPDNQEQSCRSSSLCAQTSQLFRGNELGLENTPGGKDPPSQSFAHFSLALIPESEL